jgi:hypothetical protein
MDLVIIQQPKHVLYVHHRQWLPVLAQMAAPMLIKSVLPCNLQK